MNVRRVVVGSDSKIKLRAVAAAFKVFGCDITPIDCKVPSFVPAQPKGKPTMKKGAVNRAKNAQKLIHGADLYIGIESGLIRKFGRWYNPACVAVLTSKNDRPIIVFGDYFPIPKWLVARISAQKSDIGHVIREITGSHEKDPMKWLSKGVILREHLLSQTVACALVQIFCSDQYKRFKKRDK